MAMVTARRGQHEVRVSKNSYETLFRKKGYRIVQDDDEPKKVMTETEEHVEEWQEEGKEKEIETIPISEMNKEQLAEALDAGADIIMLDNMTNEMMKECVKIVNGKALVEASGNMGEKKLRDVADTGVDIISIGALTHTIKSADISLKFSIS